jgi:two-component sensor histidine kinase
MLGRLKAMRRWPLVARLTITAAALGLAFVFQIPLENEVPGEPFLLFFLVVMGATVAFGQGAGLFGVTLSTLLSVRSFQPGATFFLERADDLIRIELYALLAAGAVIGLASLGKALLAADEAAQALARSEQEKSVLLRELAHRVANNFTAVAGLIRRKANLVDDADAKSAMNEAVDQVMVLARVHSRLHAARNDATLDGESFLHELCDDLKVLVAPDQRLSIECTAARCPLSVAQAIPVGLIVNELVTNAVKYAFPDGRSGTIHVDLQELAGRLCICIEDDGVGLSDQRARGTGLGHGLVRALAQQLGGELDIRPVSGGTKFCVTFPCVPAAGQREASAALH